MTKSPRIFTVDGTVIFCVFILSCLSTFTLRSIIPGLYPSYFMYLLFAGLSFYFILKIDFEIFEAFSNVFYVISIFLLILPLIIGQVTRGAIRWIPIGPFTIQPSEIVRPFLLLFLAKYLTAYEMDMKHLTKTFILFFIPFFLILVQPSLGVAMLTAIGFLGVLLASSIDKRYILGACLFLVLSLPLLWLVLAPYQKQRIYTFLDPFSDPKGAGYNSIQAMITVGSGQIIGRGLGEGIQTQLKFLPEKHTDFIFAAITEELGLVGAMVLLLTLFALFWFLIIIVGKAKNPTARAFSTGVLLVLLSESIIHIGMNMGLLPITGVPLPFVSAGGSALVGTAMSVAMTLNAKSD